MIKKIKSSLFAKVFIVTAILLASVCFLVYGILSWYMPQTYTNKLNADLEEQSKALISELEQTQLQNGYGLIRQFLLNSNISSVELYTSDGSRVNLPASQVDTAAQEDTATLEAAVTYINDSTPVLSCSYYFSFAGGSTRYMLIVNGEAAQIAELRHSFIQVLPLLLGIILFISLAVSWLYSRIITKPVLKICNISEDMSALRLDWQLEEYRSDELGTLEKSLNNLSHSLSVALSDLKTANTQLEIDIEHEKELEQAQLDFFSAVSHELKTPITVIKGQLEGMLLGIGTYKDHAKYLARSLEVVNTLEVMVQEILTISRLENPAADLKKETFDCVLMLQAYLLECEDLIAQKDLQLKLKLPPSIYLYGNKLLMEKVFSNLIGNAIKYSPQGAAIDIIACEQQGQYLFAIENTGTHIPEDSFSRLFEAFYRVDQSRNRKTGGSGLGLYIVQRILQQHESFCTACNTPTGVRFSFAINSVNAPNTTH